MVAKFFSMDTVIIILFEGIRLLGGPDIVDSQEAASLSHKRDDIHVYSNSWGPPDDSITVMGPGPLLQQSFMEGSTEVTH